VASTPCRSGDPIAVHPCPAPLNCFFFSPPVEGPWSPSCLVEDPSDLNFFSSFVSAVGPGLIPDFPFPPGVGPLSSIFSLSFSSFSYPSCTFPSLSVLVGFFFADFLFFERLVVTLHCQPLSVWNKPSSSLPPGVFFFVPFSLHCSRSLLLPPFEEPCFFFYWSPKSPECPFRFPPFLSLNVICSFIFFFDHPRMSLFFPVLKLIFCLFLVVVRTTYVLFFQGSFFRVTVSRESVFRSATKNITNCFECGGWGGGGGGGAVCGGGGFGLGGWGVWCWCFGVFVVQPPPPCVCGVGGVWGCVGVGEDPVPFVCGGLFVGCQKKKKKKTQTPPPTQETKPKTNPPTHNPPPKFLFWFVPPFCLIDFIPLFCFFF